jgi:penicillin-binding protein 1A
LLILAAGVLVLERVRAEFDRMKTRGRDWTARNPQSVRVLIALLVVLTVCAGWFAYSIFAGLPGKEELRALSDDSSQTTTIYDAYDRPIFSIPTEHQLEVPLARISPHLVSAILAVEDRRFHEHNGVDHLRVAAAALANIRHGRAVQGGSTITQQLARQSFLTRDKTMRRKLREAIVAERLEDLYSKDEILELYLNRVYFGNGLYGAEAAARGFFGKTAAELTLAEAALLAGLVRAPSATNPVSSLERAIGRRDVVLQVMHEHGLVDVEVLDRARRERVALHDTLRREDPIGLYFKEQVRRQLLERFGEEKIVSGRLRVYTTMDPAMQQAAEKALAESLREIEARTGPGRWSGGRTKTDGSRTANGERDDRLQGAVVALDAQTGEVRAIVGGRDTANLGLNRAVQSRRQPGSAFKPFVYAAALERGYTPATLIEHLDEPIPTYRGAWIPEDEHSTAPSMTMRTALRTSSNRAAAHMLEQVGIEPTISYASRMGIGTLPHEPSLALGSGEVTLLAMTAAYGAFAHAGVRQEPTFIRRVEDGDGNVLFRADAKPQQVLSDTTAFLMANMLADVLDVGTASPARALGFTLPAAGKTCTTNDFADAWFIGFTPMVVSGVWVGYDRPRTIMRNGFAARVAVPLWARFMKEATEKHPKIWFDPPPGVTGVQVCRLSGQLPVEGCPVFTEYFVAGTEPHETCTIHVYRYQEPLIATSGVLDLPQGEPAPPPPTSPPAPAPEPAAEALNPDSLPAQPPGR